MKQLSVVITHYRNIDLLSQCLFALENTLGNISSEIIVICSQYDPKLLKSVEETFKNVYFYHFSENLYHIRSVNRGLEKVNGEFILILNDDVVILADGLALMLDYLNKNQEVGLLGPKQIFPDGKRQDTCFRFYTFLNIVCRRTSLGKRKYCQKINNRFIYGDNDKNLPLSVDWLMGSALLTRKSVVRKVGYLDEKYIHYFGDVDWARRVWENGYKVIYFPQALIYHHHQKSSQSNGVMSVILNRMVRIHILDGIKYFLKWGTKVPNFSQFY